MSKSATHRTCSMPLRSPGDWSHRELVHLSRSWFSKAPCVWLPLLNRGDDVGRFVGCELAGPLPFDVVFCRGLQLRVDAGSWPPADTSLSMHLGSLVHVGDD